jgi:hypothetical protein
MQELGPIRKWLLATVTVLDCDKMRASGIEDDEILRASERTGTRPSRVANLIGKAKALERDLMEKITIPSLSTMVR